MADPWSLIASAPTDGALVDLWVAATTPGRVPNCYWKPASGSTPAGWWAKESLGEDVAIGAPATHWMLPPPPPVIVVLSKCPVCSADPETIVAPGTFTVHCPTYLCSFTQEGAGADLTTAGLAWNAAVAAYQPPA